MKRRAFLVLAVCLPGCVGNGEEIQEPEDIEIIWDSLIRDNPGTEEERVYVWGVARNVGDRTLNYVEIRATFFDNDGEELESVIENVQEDVSADEEWGFEIEFPDFGERAAEVEEYELEPATGV
ncbi:FxLYD domain-containing protein [Halostagnicola sp. A-GB9-2]|uniref:FxLYD domain-containing protein n=1 Tax=Halostagnicola sp. A-GB9-2 TaxID=3048066 RepID=UPI0024BF3274|nr:FxLYD domain-containing protein [Halostagnicola sp. A-GB9-2]MDJ1430612.1 FxLYD domain-containing protein [Halostagnicola sp. A-GB9-2]